MDRRASLPLSLDRNLTRPPVWSGLPRKTGHLTSVGGKAHVADRRTISKMPPICGSSAINTSRSMAKSLPVGCSIPWVIHDTIRIADSVCGSAVCTTVCVARSSAWRLSLTVASRSLQNLPTPPLHSRSRADIASVNAACAIATAGDGRDARASVVSAMLVEAKPTPAITAKTNVMAQTVHPASELERCRICQSRAAQDGITSATRSAAMPIARKSHPAISVDPSERAYQPFMAMPTPPSAKAASIKLKEMLRDAACLCDVTGGDASAGDGAGGGG